MNLFDRLPENFFSVLSRKYKAVYSFALMTLFETLKIYKTKIKRSDYIKALYDHGEDLFKLFDVELDKLDDKNEDENIPYELSDSVITSKINYIFKKLVNTGWISVERDLANNVDYLYLPSYSIKMLQLISDLSSDTSLYVPLVHQTYSELSLEDEKEDDYMFRSLLAARKNADELELNVTLLHHSICVFGHNLSTVFDPNEVLRQHFDIFKSDVRDKVYHPMKTYDSLGLYSLPVINILHRWQHDPRIMAKLVIQAKYDPNYVGKKSSLVNVEVNRILQETIDIFSRLNSAFVEIDKANASYTQAVQKKVTYLSSSDKTIKGKIDAIILEVAKALDRENSQSDLEMDKIDIIDKLNSTVSIYHQGFVDSDSLTMIKNRVEKEELDPLPLDDMYSDFDSSLDELINDENQFSLEAIENFMLKQFKDRRTITSKDVELNTMDDLILLILATVRGEFNDMFYTLEKLDSKIENGNYFIPNYKFTRKGRSANN